MNTTFHETFLVTATSTVVFVVVLVAGDTSFVSVKLCAALRMVPLHVRPSYSVKLSVPFSGAPPAEVIVAESFGRHVSRRRRARGVGHREALGRGRVTGAGVVAIPAVLGPEAVPSNRGRREGVDVAFEVNVPATPSETSVSPPEELRPAFPR